jgi:DNA-binding NarL/FixJ family response regulator
VVPSVLIVSEELDFLLACYTSLHRDIRIGQIEATTSGEEAGRLVRTLWPDAVIFDTSAGDGVTLSAVRRICELVPDAAVIVTFRDRERDTIGQMVDASGAAGVVSRDGLSVEAVLRLIRAPSPDHAESIAAPA